MLSRYVILWSLEAGWWCSFQELNSIQISEIICFQEGFVIKGSRKTYKSNNFTEFLDSVSILSIWTTHTAERCFENSQS